jgi:hypothetical protein
MQSTVDGLRTQAGCPLERDGEPSDLIRNQVFR